MGLRLLDMKVVKSTSQRTKDSWHMPISIVTTSILTPRLIVCFIYGISLTPGQLITELFPDCLKVMFFALDVTPQVVDCIYEMMCLFVVVGIKTDQESNP